MSNQLLLRRRAMMQSKKDNTLTFTAEAANSSVQLAQLGSPQAVTLEYNLNDGGWQPYMVGDTITLDAVGDKVKFKGKNKSFSTNWSNHYKFVMTGTISASGSVTSLLDGKGGYVDLSDTTNGRNYKRVFTGLFMACKSLISPPDINVKIVASNCFEGMFNGTNITSTPLLEFETAVSQCCGNMFQDCKKLTRITCLTKNLVDYSPFYCWVYGVSTQNGVFIKNPEATFWKVEISGIPNNTWTVEDYQG